MFKQTDLNTYISKQTVTNPNEVVLCSVKVFSERLREFLARSIYYISVICNRMIGWMDFNQIRWFHGWLV